MNRALFFLMAVMLPLRGLSAPDTMNFSQKGSSSYSLSTLIMDALFEAKNDTASNAAANCWVRLSSLIVMKRPCTVSDTGRLSASCAVDVIYNEYARAVCAMSISHIINSNMDILASQDSPESAINFLSKVFSAHLAQSNEKVIKDFLTPPEDFSTQSVIISDAQKIETAKLDLSYVGSKIVSGTLCNVRYISSAERFPLLQMETKNCNPFPVLTIDGIKYFSPEESIIIGKKVELSYGFERSYEVGVVK